MKVEIHTAYDKLSKNENIEKFVKSIAELSIPQILRFYSFMSYDKLKILRNLGYRTENLTKMDENKINNIEVIISANIIQNRLYETRQGMFLFHNYKMLTNKFNNSK